MYLAVYSRVNMYWILAMAVCIAAASAPRTSASMVRIFVAGTTIATSSQSISSCGRRLQISCRAPAPVRWQCVTKRNPFCVAAAAARLADGQMAGTISVVRPVFSDASCTAARTTAPIWHASAHEQGRY